MEYPYKASLEDAMRYLPGGVINTGGLNMPGKPEFIFSHGAGAYAYTTDGRRFMDVVLGSATLIQGHCPPAIVAAAKAQLDRGTTFAHTTPPAVELAHLIVDAVPCAKKVRLFNSGSEGILYALRLVRAFTGKEKILKLEGAYHGFGDAMMFNTNYGDPDGWAAAPQATPDTLGIPRCERDLVLVTPYNDVDRARQIIRDHHAELAAIFVEPVMRGLAPLPGFLEGMRQLATQYRVPLVFDEVITGFRVAYGGAQARYGVTPDLVVLGKGMGAGYPIGAVAGNEEIMSFLDPASPDDRRIYALGSFYGNALCAAAAAANLTELRKPGTYEHLTGYGNRLREGLAEIFGRHGLPVQMTGLGSIVEFFFTSEPITDYRSTRRSNLRLKGLLGQELPRRGVHGGGGRYVSSTVHGDAELRIMLNAVDESMGAIVRAGGF